MGVQAAASLVSQLRRLCSVAKAQAQHFIDEHDKSGKAGGEGLGAQALASDDELQARKQTPYVLASHP